MKKRKREDNQNAASDKTCKRMWICAACILAGLILIVTMICILIKPASEPENVESNSEDRVTEAASEGVMTVYGEITEEALLENLQSSIVKIEIVGSGDLLLENTSVYSDTVISLCKKSGSFWNGSIAIRNLNVKNKGAVNLIDGAWYNHDFGYLTSFPKEITVEGITLKKSDKIHLFSSELLTQTKLAVMEEWEAPVLDENGNETGQNEAVYNINPTSSTDKVSIDAASDYEIIIPDSEEFSFFADTDFVILE